MEPVQEPVAAPPGSDFESLLTDYEIGRIATMAELKGRLAPSSSGFVYVDGRVLSDGRNGSVQERRKVDERQEACVLAEAKAFDTLRQSGRNAEGYASFYQDIISGKIARVPELKGRLAPSSSGFVYVDGRALSDGRNGSVQERRKVDERQEKRLVELKEIVDQADATLTSMTDALSFTDDILDRRITSLAELKGRLNAKNYGFVYVDGRALSDGRNGSVQEFRRVDKQRQRFLTETFESMRAIDDFVYSTQSERSYIIDILSGKIASKAELKGRLAPSSSGFVYVDGRALSDANGYVSERRRVDKDGAKGLLRFFDEVAITDTEVRGRLSAAQTGKAPLDAADRLMEARRRQSLNKSDLALNEQEGRRVRELTKFLYRTDLRRRAADNIRQYPDDVRQNFVLFRDYGLDDEADRQLVQQLTATTYDMRRLCFSRDILRELNGINATEGYSALLRRLAEFADSPFAADKQQAELLQGFTYDHELARQTKMLLARLSPDRYDRQDYASYTGSLPLRASTSSFDYKARLEALLGRLQPFAAEAEQVPLVREVTALVARFRSSRTTDILEAINSLDEPEDTAIRAQVLAFYKQYLLSRRTSRPNDYREAFAFEVAALRSVIAPSYDFDQGLGKNIEALTYLARQFKRSVAPLFESLLGKRAGKGLEAYIRRQADGTDPRQKYTLKLATLALQRELSPIESSYLQSVESLSLFNPHLVALANVAPRTTSIYLESYFRDLSRQTFGHLEDGIRVPFMQIGLGPDGLAAASELVRSRPDLAAGALFVDQAALPGGPFAIPKGRAWNLNSASGREVEAPVLPNAAPAELQGNTVRDYGDPTRWYPGERLAGSDTRAGSINNNSGYLLSPDALSGNYYPNNADEALTLQLQAAVLLQNCLLTTQVISAEPCPQSDNPECVAVTLRYNATEGIAHTRRLLVDRLVCASGIGDPYYGFDLEGSKAQNILKVSAAWDGSFPKLSDTLGAFTALASEEGPQAVPGETMVLGGGGNSVDTLLEYLGGLFDSNNRNVRNVKKIYVVTKGKLSQRPRYAAIRDLLERNGRGNLVEIVNARVGDVDFADEPSPKSKLKLFDSDGNELKNAAGAPIRADNVILATGFRSTLSKVLQPLLRQPGGVENAANLVPITLPTNKNVSVGDRLKDNSHVLLVGTASRPGFEIRDKLDQLPSDAREALLRNGAENAVAIGFRAPDTQAATRLFLDTIPRQIAASAINVRTPRLLSAQNTLPADQTTMHARKDMRPVPIRRAAEPNPALLAPLLVRPLMDIKMDDTSPQTYRFSVRLDAGAVAVTNRTAVPQSLMAAVAQACSDPYFYAYAREAVAPGSDYEQIDIKLDIRNGKISPRRCVVRPVQAA